MKPNMFLCAGVLVLFSSVTAAAQQQASDQPYRNGEHDAITDVPGVQVGHYTHTKGTMRGITAVLAGERGGMCAAEVRGSNPGTIGDGMYDPLNIAEHCDAVVLTGGSLWGFATVPGVMDYLAEQGRGVQTRGGRLPLVPGAVIFDLPIGDANIRPQREWGYAAAKAARGGPMQQGNIGAGAGGTMGKLPGGVPLKGGLGTASAILPDGVVVGVIVVLNAVGDVINPASGEFYAVSGGFHQAQYRHHHTPIARPSPAELHLGAAAETLEEPILGQNTTLVVVATNARLSKMQLAKIAQLAHDGLARAIRPVHTMWDGDTVFTMSVGGDDRVQPDVAYGAEAVDRIGAVAGDLVVRAVLKGTEAAESIPGWPSYREWRKGQTAPR